jgi:hypothetical protein
MKTLSVSHSLSLSSSQIFRYILEDFNHFINIFFKQKSNVYLDLSLSFLFIAVADATGAVSAHFPRILILEAFYYANATAATRRRRGLGLIPPGHLVWFAKRFFSSQDEVLKKKNT